MANEEYPLIERRTGGPSVDEMCQHFQKKQELELSGKREEAAA